MRIIQNFTFLILWSFAACAQPSSKNYEKAILGEWTFAKEQRENQNTSPLLFGEDPKEGYNFLPDNVCENKLGYFKRIEGKNFFDARSFFLGTTTKYEIENDDLKIYNLYDSTWSSQRIVSISADTMTLQKNDSTIVKFVKANYHIDDKETYDEIIISSSGCYGTCPINSTSINKSGEVIYYGYEFNTVNGYYKSQVNSSVFSKIESDFKKSNIAKLQDDYSADWTDDESISVTFIKDNRIVKSISDYGRQSPTEFYWAYQAARYLYQQIQLDTMHNRLNFTPFVLANFNREGKVCDLTQAEGFYLWTLLLRSNETNEAFSGKYTVGDDWSSENVTIKTDGQHFEFKENNGSSKSYDIRFNFIERNGIESRCR